MIKVNEKISQGGHMDGLTNIYFKDFLFKAVPSVDYIPFRAGRVRPGVGVNANLIIFCQWRGEGGPGGGGGQRKFKQKSSVVKAIFFLYSLLIP